MATPFTRAIVIVLDSVGIGELPDAGAYGDQGSNTLRNIARQIPLKLPTLRALGLDRLVDLGPGGHIDPPLRPSNVGAGFSRPVRNSDSRPRRCGGPRSRAARRAA